MSNLQQREYYKIFTGTNQEEGYDKIHLGYESDTAEIVFKKDKSTFFHVPYFAAPQTILDSTLVADGATPGPIPALADRVYKKLGGYGESTPWGDTVDQKDGTWLCSWLYALSSETPRWLDRYYHPGRLAYDEVLEGEANFGDYYSHDPIYYDIPSLLTFEPGVQYQYFHQGENTVKDIIATFSGDDKSRLRLDIENWNNGNSEFLDTSIYKNVIKIDNFKSDWVLSSSEPGYLDRNFLSFNNTDFINCKINYNDSYNLKDEFTISFWINHHDWSEATSTQLLGNLRRGGYGIFYNNLYQNPFFVIPENTYGHLFYVNQETNVYLDKNVQFSLGESANPISVCINSSSEVISLDSKNLRIVKYNHIGDVMTLNKTLSGGSFLLKGEPRKMILDGSDNCFVLTTSATYIFDKDLLLSATDFNSPYINNEQIAFDFNGNLVREPNCLSVKFTEDNQKWVIKNDGNLYCDDVLIESAPTNGKGSTLTVDPEGNVWVLANSDHIYKIDPINKTLIATYNVGVSTSEDDIKNIGFVKNYNRNTNQHIWYAVIYHNFEKNLYFVTLDGKISKNILLPEKLNIYEAATALQNPEILQFTGGGDFTGYEQKRVFNKVKFNNNPQINFKVAVKSPNNSLPNSTYTLSVPVHYFTNKTWYLITATVKNRNLSLYVNNYLRDSIELPGNKDLNFEYKTDFFIGTPAGKSDNFNKEIHSNSVIWNGYLDGVKIYDHPLESKFVQYFVREKITPLDIVWNLPTAPLQYVEVIDRFFKHKLPGSKSSFFNVRIKGSGINNSEIKKLIEENLRKAVERIKPAYTELLKIEWID
jgi:hypothetical protein